METIYLSKPLNIKGEKVQKLSFDFDKITGRMMMETETECRAMGDNTPDLTFSMKYQAMLAAKTTGIIYDDLMDLSGKDMALVLAEVKNFLFGQGSVKKTEPALKEVSK